MLSCLESGYLSCGQGKSRRENGRRQNIFTRLAAASVQEDDIVMDGNSYKVSLDLCEAGITRRSDGLSTKDFGGI